MAPETMLAPPTNGQRADALEQVRERLQEVFDDARQILEGTGPVLRDARPWLMRLDQALGSEPTVTIDDTISRLRGA